MTGCRSSADCHPRTLGQWAVRCGLAAELRCRRWADPTRTVWYLLLLSCSAHRAGPGWWRRSALRWRVPRVRRRAWERWPTRPCRSSSSASRRSWRWLAAEPPPVPCRCSASRHGRAGTDRSPPRSLPAEAGSRRPPWSGVSLRTPVAGRRPTHEHDEPQQHPGRLRPAPVSMPSRVRCASSSRPGRHRPPLGPCLPVGVGLADPPQVQVVQRQDDAPADQWDDGPQNPVRKEKLRTIRAVMTRTYRAAWAVKLPLASSKVISRIQLTSSPMPSATPATSGCGHRLGSPRAARPAGPRPIAAPCSRDQADQEAGSTLPSGRPRGLGHPAVPGRLLPRRSLQRSLLGCSGCAEAATSTTSRRVRGSSPSP